MTWFRKERPCLFEVRAFESWCMMGYLLKAWLKGSLQSHPLWTLSALEFLYFKEKKILLNQQQCRVVPMIEQ